MRDFCLDCVIKHLGQAYVLHGEVCQGYPEHILGVIGHLAEASEESIGASKELADKFRQYRLLLHENIEEILACNYTVNIPYFKLLQEVMVVMKEKGCGNCRKAKVDFKQRLQKRKETTHTVKMSMGNTNMETGENI